MNKLIKRYTYILGLAAAFLVSGCTDDIDPEITTLNVSRLFSPVGIKAFVVNKTSVRLEWRLVKNATTYTIEFYDNGQLNFSGNPEKTVSGVTFSQLPITIPGLSGETDYSVRVKAVGEGINDSKWVSAVFRTDAEQIFLPINPDELKAKEVTLRWPAGQFASSVVITPGNITHTVTASEIATGAVTISGLTGETTYTAKLMNGLKTRGTLVFTTLIDLQGATPVYPADNLNDVIQAAQAGTVLALFPGEYTVHQGNIVINKSITLKGVYPHNKPVLNNRFVLSAGVNDFIVKDLEMVGTYGSPSVIMTQAIFFDPGTYNINSIVIDGCIVRNYDRALIFGGTAVAKVETLDIDNCIMSNIVNDTGDFIDFRTGHVVNLNIKRSTFNRVAALPRDFIRLDNSSPSFPGSTSKVLLDRCTFYNVAGNATSGRRILYVRFVNNTSTVTKCIFAGSTGYLGYYTNQALTTQPTCSLNNYFNAPQFLGGVTSGKFDNSGNHTTLNPGFVDVATGNFKLTNLDLILNGIGDPRWLQ